MGAVAQFVPLPGGRVWEDGWPACAIPKPAIWADQGLGAMDSTDSKLRRLTLPDDAVSQLEGRGKDSLQRLLVLLEIPKSGNLSELALRVAEHVGDGSKIKKELNAKTVRGYLRKLGVSTEGDPAERAACYAKALQSCYKERMSVDGYRWDLEDRKFHKGSQTHPLEKLKTLCKQRCPDKMVPGMHQKTLMALLATWRREQRQGGGGGDEDEEEEGDIESGDSVEHQSEGETAGNDDNDDGAGGGDRGEQAGEEEGDEQSGGKREAIDWSWLSLLPPRHLKNILWEMTPRAKKQCANCPSAKDKLVERLQSVGPSSKALETLCTELSVYCCKTDRRWKLAERLSKHLLDKLAAPKRKRATEGKDAATDQSGGSSSDPPSKRMASGQRLVQDDNSSEEDVASTAAHTEPATADAIASTAAVSVATVSAGPAFAASAVNAGADDAEAGDSIDNDKKDLVGGLTQLDNFDNNENQIKTKSEEKKNERIKRFEHKEHINIVPVYLGICPEYRNMRKTVKSHDLGRCVAACLPNNFPGSLIVLTVTIKSPQTN